MRHLIRLVAPVLLISVWACAHAQEKSRSTANSIPPKVVDALKAKFPKAEIDKWTKETENGTVLYDIEFKEQGQKLEADIKEDGTIHNWEKAITASDLPMTVHKTVKQKYPKGKMKEIMRITAVKERNDQLEGYEIVLKLHGRKDVEVTVTPDGKLVEDSGAKKK